MRVVDGTPKGKSRSYFQKLGMDGCWAGKSYRALAGLKHQVRILNFPASICLSLFLHSSVSSGHPSLWPLQGVTAALISAGVLIACQSPSELWHLYFISHGVLEPPGPQPPPSCFHLCPSPSASGQLFSCSLFCKKWAVSYLLTHIWPWHAEFLFFLPPL